jgi:hypothetical protein
MAFMRARAPLNLSRCRAHCIFDHQCINILHEPDPTRNSCPGFPSRCLPPFCLPSSRHPQSLRRHDPVATPSSACCSPAVPAVVFLLSSCCPLRLKANLRPCSTHFSACRACTSGVPTGLESARIRGGIQTGPVRLPLYCAAFRAGHRMSST